MPLSYTNSSEKMIFKIGQEANFIAFSNGVVEDLNTGLQWFGSSSYDGWGMANWGIRQLKIGGGKWRMPSIEELKTLYHVGTARLNFTGLLMNHYMASNIESREYNAWRVWSSERIPEGKEDNALCFIFPEGNVKEFPCRDHCGRWFAVRQAINMNEILENPSLSDDSHFEIMHDDDLILFNDFVISDESSTFDWYVGPDTDMTLNEAREWVAQLNIRGGGWRLPKHSELKNIYDHNNGERNLSHLFKTNGWFVWSDEEKTNSLFGRFFLFNGLMFFSSNSESFGCRAFAIRDSKK